MIIVQGCRPRSISTPTREMPSRSQTNTMLAELDGAISADAATGSGWLRAFM
jgi:hypothetical protein